MKNRICLVAYTYRGYSTEYLFRKAKEYGYGGIEYRNDLTDTDFSTIESFKKSLKTGLKYSKKYNVDIPVVYRSFSLIDDNKKTIEKNVKMMIGIIKVLSEHGINILHTQVGHLAGNNSEDFAHNGSGMAKEYHYRRVSNALSQVAEEIKNSGVTVAIETHMNTITDNIKSMLKILDTVKSPVIKCCLDFANLRITPQGEDPVSAITIIGGNKISYTHCKNVKLYSWGYDWAIPISDGELNYPFILRKLDEVGYKGYFGLEYCGLGDPNVFAKRNIEYFRYIIRNLRKY
jgi:sugar phosphate isomerase/epimerase